MMKTENKLLNRNMSGCAWVTYADTTGYWKGALVLAHSLIKTNSQFPLIVFVPEDFVRDSNVPPNMRVRACKPILHDGKQATRPEYRSCLNKLIAWTLTEYERVGWLDCDMLIIRNIDNVFEMELNEGEMLAAPGCKCNVFDNPKLPKVPHQCPLLNNQNIYVNTGLFVIRPSTRVFAELIKCKYDYPLPDQDAFNVYFQGRLRCLDPSYNYMVHLSLAHPDLDMRDLRVIHFTYDKPWHKDVDAILPFSKEWHVIWHAYADNKQTTKEMEQRC